MFCCQNRPALIPEILSFENINITLKNNDDQTALDIAKKMDNGSYNILKSFQEHKKLQYIKPTSQKKASRRIL